MKQYKILTNNKTWMVRDLEWAKTIAKRESQVGGRVSVLDGDIKIATYQNGKEI